MKRTGTCVPATIATEGPLQQLRPPAPAALFPPGHRGEGSRSPRGVPPGPPRPARSGRPLAARTDPAEQHDPAPRAPTAGKSEGSRGSSWVGTRPPSAAPLLCGGPAFSELRGQPCPSSGVNPSSARPPPRAPPAAGVVRVAGPWGKRGRKSRPSVTSPTRWPEPLREELASRGGASALCPALYGGT